MSNSSTNKNKISGRKIAIIILAGIFGGLNAISFLTLIFSGVIFSGDFVLDLANLTTVISVLCYLGIILLSIRNRMRVAALLIIPIFFGNVLFLVWAAVQGFPIDWYLPVISILQLNPDFWYSYLLTAFELPALIAILLLLVIQPQSQPQATSVAIPAEVPPNAALLSTVNFCPSCGAPASGDAFCSKCGANIAAPAIPNSSQTYGSTLSSTALIGFIAVWFIPLVGIILGYIAKRDIDRNPSQLRGRGLAIASIVLGWIGIAGYIVWILVALAIASQLPSYY